MFDREFNPGLEQVGRKVDSEASTDDMYVKVYSKLSKSKKVAMLH